MTSGSVATDEAATSVTARQADARPAVVARVRWWNALVIGVTVTAFAVLAWQRRWMCDDGLIVLRTVRNLLAGNGPVFNAGERVETNTSTLWTGMLAVAGLVPGVTLPVAAVMLGLMLSVLGLTLALDGARRLHRAGRPDSVLARLAVVPVGALVLIALPPFRDFATSGLETGLITGWLGLSWWLLVLLGQGVRGGLPWLAAFVIGLGPLVRPDLAIFSGFLLLAAAVLVRPSWLRLIGLAATAAALPVAYQIFRMGYYGLLVPSTALAKEARIARWEQGWSYLGDLASPYWLWVPILLLLGLFGLVAAGRVGRRRLALIALAPVLASIVLALYVVRVGGDFMHGRMLLPALFGLLLPVMVVPITRRLVVLPAIGVLVWAIVAMGWLRVPYGGSINPETGITDERAFYTRIVRHEHPITPADHSAQRLPVRAVKQASDLDEHAVLLLDHRSGRAVWRAAPSRADVDHTTVVFLVIGVTAGLAPLDLHVVDPVGLTSPLARHAGHIPDGRIGHDKDLPPEWYLADEADLSKLSDVNWPILMAAERALACPERQEMLASVRAPLTWDRFKQNFADAIERGQLRYPRDPVAAATSCGVRS
jgi:arabinofuranosyltransferase